MDSPRTGATPQATSELNNLLQIISGTSSLLENIWEGNRDSEKYFAMLRASVERAELIAAQLVEQAGGVGTKVLVNPELSEFAQKRVTQLPIVKPRVLVVDDEGMALLLIDRILTEAGFEVVTAQSGFECLDTFRSQPTKFDLVIVDLTMPFMEGDETFRRLRAISADVPVVLSTGFIEEGRLQQMLKEGLAGFIRKPLGADEIVSSVRSILQTVQAQGSASQPGGIVAAL
ncbi:MAG: response regulator [Chthoniobacterales bacterium]